MHHFVLQWLQFFYFFFFLSPMDVYEWELTHLVSILSFSLSRKGLKFVWRLKLGAASQFDSHKYSSSKNNLNFQLVPLVLKPSGIRISSMVNVLSIERVSHALPLRFILLPSFSHSHLSFRSPILVLDSVSLLQLLAPMSSPPILREWDYSRETTPTLIFPTPMLLSG